jgi:hypothetical protein
MSEIAWFQHPRLLVLGGGIITIILSRGSRVSNLIEIRGEGANVALEIAKFERPNSTSPASSNLP